MLEGPAVPRSALKVPDGHDDTTDMSDLSNLLGDVYGKGDLDGPGVRHEPPAAARTAEPAEAAPSWTSAAPAEDGTAAWLTAETGSAPLLPGMSAHLWVRGDDDIFPLGRS